MSDAEKLSAPSFEQMTAGVTLGSTVLTVPATGPQDTSTVVDTFSSKLWDMLILDSPDPVATTTPAPPAMTASPYRLAEARSDAALSTTQQVTVPGSLLSAQLPGASAAVNGPSGRGSAFYTRPGLGNGVAVQQPSYAVVGMNLAPVGGDDLERGLPLGLPTAAGARATPTVGVAGQDWQVVYDSEVAG
jgi:hypothetical protein